MSNKWPVAYPKFECWTGNDEPVTNFTEPTLRIRIKHLQNIANQGVVATTGCMCRYVNLKVWDSYIV